MANVVKRIKYSPRKTRSNPWWFAPLLLVGGGGAALWFFRSQLEKLFGGQKQLAMIVPPLAVAGGISFFVRPKVDPRFRKYLDMTSIGLAGLASIGAIIGAIDPESKNLGVKGQATHTYKSLINGVPFFEIKMAMPSTSLGGDTFRFNVKNTHGSPLAFYARIEGRPGWEDVGETKALWQDAQQYALDPGKTKEISATAGLPVPAWILPGWLLGKAVAATGATESKYQYRILLSSDTTFEGKRLMSITPWYNYKTVSIKVS